MARCTVITALMAALIALPGEAEAVAFDQDPSKGLLEAAIAVLSKRLNTQTDNFSLRPVSGTAASPCRTGQTEVVDSMILTPEISTRMAVRMQIRCGGSSRLRSATQWFAVTATAKVPVIRRDVQEHTILQTADVVWETRDVAKLRGRAARPGFLQSPVRVRVPLHGGQPILADQLEPRPDVVAGSLVRAVYRSDGATLQFTAVALDDANTGYALRIERPGATGLLQAKVIGNGAVEVTE